MTLKAETSLHIDAPPDRVWRLVTDVTRMPEWSPITYRCVWQGDVTVPVVGARFKGYNRLAPVQWWTLCEVTALESARLFEFRTIDGTFSIGSRGREMTRWRYSFEPEGIGTLVTESYEVSHIPALLRVPEVIVNKIPGGKGMIARRRGKTDDSMEVTLRRLKEAAEAPG
jgi:uncharacterized protein YndB with AHSA1/START domain